MFGFGSIDKFSSATVYLKCLYQAGKVSDHDLCVKGVHVTSLYVFFYCTTVLCEQFRQRDVLF